MSPYSEEDVPALPEEAPGYPPEEAPEEEEGGAYSEEEIAPPVLYIEIPGEEAVAMEGDEFIIGRGKMCNFVIDSNRVSRQHARVIRDADGFILEDLNSSNGTFFGKQREKISRRKIADGDEFIFGTERVTFYIQ
jgi:putative peptide zinc metalloprotease protein